MDGNGDCSMDEASIKPVSSLRSHFERMSNAEASPTPLYSRFNANGHQGVVHDGEETHTYLRPSLPLARRSSAICTSPQLLKDRGLGSNGPQRLGATSTSQRPLSIRSLSAPKSPPLVTVASPKSPTNQSGPSDAVRFPSSAVPKGSLPRPSIPLMGPAGVSSSMRPVAAELTDAHILSYAKPSPGTLESRRAFTEVQNSAGTSEDKDLIQPRFRSRKPLREVSGSTRRPVPPTINRADKPKIPSKPLAIGIEPGLKPIESFGQERASPFSTPPNSDEDTIVNIPLNGVGDPRQDNTAGGPADGHQGLSSLFESSKPRSRKRSISNESLKTFKGQDAQAYGFSVRNSRYADIKDDKPSLPLGGQRVGSDKVSLKSHSESLKGLGRSLSGSQTNGKPSGLAPGHDSISSSSSSTFLPPPKRNPQPSGRRVPDDQAHTFHYLGAKSGSNVDYDIDSSGSSTASYPDISNIDRRFPYCPAGARVIDVGYDTRLIDICGRHLSTAGYVTRIWDVLTGEILVDFEHVEKDVKVTALGYKPGVKASEEGFCVWLGTNQGEIQEVDVPSKRVVHRKSGAHEKREVVKILRHQNNMWSLDDGGKLCVWQADETGLPSLQRRHISHRVPRSHSCSLVIQDTLWLATGKEIRLFLPNMDDSAAFNVLPSPLSQSHLGIITSGTVVGGQPDRVYFGHADGKVSVYSIFNYSCLAIVNVNVYKINCLAGAGCYLWAAYSLGMIFVYDTRTQPWTTRKGWMAHKGSPVLNLAVDRSSLWKTGILRVASVGADNAIRFWDGTLEDEWMASDMQDHDVAYCTFQEISVRVVTWNAGAATPTHLRYDEADSKFFRDIISTEESPDLLVFGFQELVDLEDKKLTAKTLLKGNKKRDPAEQEHMSRQYRTWRDYLTKCVEESMPSHEPYSLLHTANMVGLFTCIFIKPSQRNRVRKVSTGEIKRGMGGLHGNKGALVVRFTYDDTSICLVNCHLAAGQTQTSNRNNDLMAILESEVLPAERDAVARKSIFTDGGDGSMILDHEICILNGDLNYRIDTMSREIVIRAINANNLAKLLERDQLLVSRRRNPMFRLRAFGESSISFAPTYKYDVGSNTYDTSEKRRAPAWCDRILYRGAGKIKQLEYRRHELQVSDHRPVSGAFKMRVKSISAEKRAQTWTQCEKRFVLVKENLATESKLEYLRDVLGVPLDEAKLLI